MLFSSLTGFVNWLETNGFHSWIDDTHLLLTVLLYFIAFLMVLTLCVVFLCFYIAPSFISNSPGNLVWDFCLPFVNFRWRIFFMKFIMEGPSSLAVSGVFIVNDSSWFHLPVPCIAPLHHLHVIPSLHGGTLYIIAPDCSLILPHETVTCTIFVF